MTKKNLERETRIINVMVNTTVVMMSSLMGAFSEVMVEATSAMAEGMTEAFAGKEESKKTKKAVDEKLPVVDEKMKQMVSELKKQMYTQLQQKKKEITPLLSDPVFDAGPKIVEEYDFNLPKLTEELDDQTLAQYTQMGATGNPRFLEMFRQLTEWLNTLPINKKPTSD